MIRCFSVLILQLETHNKTICNVMFRALIVMLCFVPIRLCEAISSFSGDINNVIDFEIKKCIGIQISKRRYIKN